MKNPEAYGQYLCLFEGINSISRYHYWDVVSWYNHFQDGDCWNIDPEQHQGNKIVKFFALPSFVTGLLSESGNQVAILPKQ